MPIPISNSDTRTSRASEVVLRRLLLRALNRNQRLILQAVSEIRLATITSILRFLSREFNIPLSTLKLNARILKELGLIDFGNTKQIKAAKLTPAGELVVTILNGEIKR